MTPNQRLHADAHARQVRIVARSERAATAVDRTVRRIWDALLQTLTLPWAETRAWAELLMRALPGQVSQSIDAELRGTVGMVQRSVRASLSRALPIEVLRGAVYGTDRRHVARWLEDHERGTPRQGGDGRLVEEGPGDSDRHGGSTDFGWTDLLSPFRAVDHLGGDHPGNDRGDLLSLLFPAPTAERIDAIVYASGWPERIRSGTGLADPAHLAQRIATGLLLGHSQQQIARDILPAVQGVQSSARRIARTESLRVASAVQLDCHEALGDAVVGYRLLSVRGETTRPWHAARHNHVYYAHPTAGQKGYPQMPNPPEEPADPTERPAGTPQIAWNCL